MDIPVELIELIAQNLTKKDIKNLRLASRRLAEITADFLYRTIFLSPDPLDLMHAESALAHFPSLIRTIIVSPLRYAMIGRADHLFRVECSKGRTSLPDNHRYFEHVEMGYKTYRTLRQRVGHHGGKTQMNQLLQRVLRTAPNVRKMTIANRHRHQELTDWEMARYCRWGDCPMSRAMHGMFRVGHLKAYDCPRTSEFTNSMFAIVPAGTAKIKEVFMDSIDSRGSLPGPYYYEHHTFYGMPIETFDNPYQYTYQSIVFAGNLKKLRLNLDDKVPEEVKIEGGAFSMFLSKTKNLEFLSLDTRSQYLHLDYINEHGDWFRHTLGSTRLPKLRVLVLEKIAMTGNELVSFLEGSPALRHLVIEDAFLKDNLWRLLIEDIKASTHLGAIHMNFLSGGFDAHFSWSSRTHYVDHHGDVGKFVFHGGPNPFSQDMIHEHINETYGKYPYALLSDNCPPRRPRNVAQEYNEKYF